MPTVVHKIEYAVFAPLNKLSASFREFSEQNIQCSFAHVFDYLLYSYISVAFCFVQIYRCRMDHYFTNLCV